MLFPEIAYLNLAYQSPNLTMRGIPVAECALRRKLGQAPRPNAGIIAHCYALKRRGKVPLTNPHK